MGQDDLPHDGAVDDHKSTPARPSRSRPQYMTVGSGSTSASAAALMATLDDDSGYGSAIPGDGLSNDGSVRGWNPRRTHDLPTPSPSPSHSNALGGGDGISDHERRVLASHVHQLQYNQNRAALGRAIARTIGLLQELQRRNVEWPAHYPSIHSRSEAQSTRSETRPNLLHTQSAIGGSLDSQAVANSPSPHPSARPAPRRAATLTSDAESSSMAEQKELARREAAPETLITPQAVQDFSILKLDLKLQGLTQSEIAHSMDRRAIASLLDGRINQSMRHLLSLRDRIEDTSSKVLVTGDLNAGKSTFCNALLRRKVLPEDQQPCTSIFCEVLDARENGGLEEVHAIHKHAIYNRHDESTYDVYTLHELEKIVIDNERYMQCKVYVKDTRAIDQSLLNNGVVDISLIDAPGLNSDSLKTTAVFARQEEIDVVVFVVSAANHFTLSAKEFILNAAHEKAYMFFVVNGFDNIRDQERCQRLVLEQVAHLSPRTFKESSELVHFVSSNAVPVAPALPAGGPSGPGGSGGSSGSSGFSSDPHPEDEEEDDDHGTPRKHAQSETPPGKGKGKQKERIEDFNHLETSLRRFVLEKRARSKLAPAKTYLSNVLRDLNSLATVNRDVAQQELDRVTLELAEIESAFEESKKARSQVSDEIDQTIEQTCTNIYKTTRSSLDTAIADVANADLGVAYPGLLHAFQYADDINNAILDQITQAVARCEEDARMQTVESIAFIDTASRRHLGTEHEELTFRSDIMFRKRRDALARQVDAPVELWDFVDVSGMWERQEKVAGTGMAVTIAGVLGSRLVGGVGWVDGAMGAARIMGARQLRSMIVPGLVAAGIAYVVRSVPTALPHRLARRVAHTLDRLDYTHLNSQRVTNEVAKVLRYPADHLRLGLQRSVEQLGARRAQTATTQREASGARKYFGNLVRESTEARRAVDNVDLDGPGSGVAGSVDSGIMV